MCSSDLLNNRFMLRMSENVANRIQQEAERVDGGFSTSSKEDRQVTIAYRTLFQRSPSPNEREVIREVIQRLGLPQACRLLMNSNEFVFVD